MIVLKVLGVLLKTIAVLLVLLLLMPYGVDVGYLDSVFFLKVKAGPLRIGILPKKEKPGKEKKPKEKKEKKEKPPKEEAGGKKKKSFLPKAGFTDWVDLGKEALGAVGKILHSFRLNLLKADITVASDDPYDTGTRYAYLCAAAETLLNDDTGVLHPQKKEITLDMDFTSEKLTAEGELVISAALWRIVWAALVLGVYFLRWRSKLKKIEKMNKSAETERTENHGREQDQ